MHRVRELGPALERLVQERDRGAAAGVDRAAEAVAEATELHAGRPPNGREWTACGNG